ncbi:MAG TPA: glycosyltransferase family 39 protein [Mycobacteriales bacterium]|nr:glycosyltransferase family 39 protein [Mycobacteriales bacterium]
MTELVDLSADQRRELDLPVDPPRDPVGGWRSTRAKTQAWVWRHRRSLLIVTPLLIVVALVRFWGLSHGPGLADDEGTYVAEAWAVQVRHALAPYTYWYDHPPFGWIQIAAYTALTGTFHGGALHVVAVRRMMVGYAVIDAGLIYMLARRLGIARLWAAVAVGMWALSPLAVGYSRMVYLDNVALPWVLGAFVLAATPRKSLWAHTLAGAMFALGVLSKETMILLLPAFLWLAWRHTDRRTRSFCLVGMCATGILVVAIYPLMAALRGELLPGPAHVSLLDALKWQFFSRPTTGSALSPHSPSRALLDSWLGLDSWLPWLGVVGGFGCLVWARLRPLGATLLILLAAGLRPGYLPQPYIIAFLPFAAVAAAGVADAGWSALHARPPVPIRAGARQEARLLAAGRAGATIAAVAVAAIVVPGWLHGDAALAGPDQSAPIAAAENWLDAHARTAVLSRSANRTGFGRDVLVDDTMWADLVTQGFPQRQVIWFYKLDYVDNLDPSVRRRIHDFRDFGYVVSSPIVRGGLAQSPAPRYELARLALSHATPVATFGQGANRIVIERVNTATTPRRQR